MTEPADPMTASSRCAEPSAAARARAMLEQATDLRVGVGDELCQVRSHRVASDGSLLFVAGSGSREAAFSHVASWRRPDVTAEAVDVSPVPMRDRVRGVLTLTGNLGSEVVDAGMFGQPQRVCRLEPTSVTLAWCSSAEPVSVDIEEYQAAVPDPFSSSEREHLVHLHEEHGVLLGALAVAVSTDGSVIDAEVRPLALDSGGLELRVERSGERNHVRLPFAAPAECACELRDAMSSLVTHWLAEPASD